MACSFGREMREKHFPFQPDYVNINHGSFGTLPNQVLAAQRDFQARAEATPDPFIRYELPKLVDEARQTVADVVNASLSTVVLIPNATTGINTIFRNLKYQPEDVIIYFSTSYGACQNVVLATCEFQGCKRHCIQLTYPLSDAALLSKVEDAVAKLREAGLRPRALLLDTVVSAPGVRMPFESLVAACKRHNILSVVDAAHAYGLLTLDIQALDPDFLVSNCHKWGLVPRPCAMLYVPERNQHLIRTSFPTSHYFIPEPIPDALAGDEEGDARFNPLPPAAADESPFTKQFGFVGTADSSPYMCLPAAFAFRRDVCGGEAAVQGYCNDLAREGGALVAKALGTEIMDNDEGTLTKDCPMVNIRLPLRLTDVPGTEPVAEPGDADVSTGGAGPMAVVQWGMKQSTLHHTFIPFLWHGNALWIRLCGQVYLDLDDFERTAKIVKELCERLVAGDHLK